MKSSLKPFSTFSKLSIQTLDKDVIKINKKDKDHEFRSCAELSNKLTFISL